MGENNPPSLEELGDGDELPNHWKEETTITVTRYTKARLDENRDGVPWDTYLETLRREHADPLTLSDADDIADEIMGRIHMALNDENDELATEIRRLREQVERVPEDTAEALGERFA